MAPRPIAPLRRTLALGVAAAIAIILLSVAIRHLSDSYGVAGLPPLTPESPWHGYSLGDWNNKWEAMAKRATDGDYLINGERTAQLKQKLVDPQVSIRDVLGNDIVEDRDTGET